MRWLTALCLLLALQAPAWGWGAKGHRIIGTLAARNLPARVPAFLRRPGAVWQIGELAREPDRARGAGKPHDPDRDPAHFVDESDDGTVMGGPALAALPPDREQYDTALRAAGSDQYKAGWLPYAIMDGWQQLVKDFALWRADVAGLRHAKSRAARAWLLRDRRLREALTVRDLGVWAHFVGDASQPLHVTVHYNGWGDFPDPEGFKSGAPDFHSRFETAFVDDHVAPGDVAKALRPYRACDCDIAQHTIGYLAATHDTVLSAYRLDKQGAFAAASPEARAFVTARLAEGAAMLRDLVADAWDASGRASLGYKPTVPLADIEAGRADPLPLLRN